MEGRDEKGRFTEGNQLQSNGGRPPYFESAEEMERLADEYFLQCKEEKKPYTLTGLTLHLGFCAKEALYYYRDNKPEFFSPIKKALLRVEMGYEERLSENAAAGSIFALKNFGWEDNRKVDQTTTVSFKVPTGQTDLESDDLD